MRASSPRREASGIREAHSRSSGACTMSMISGTNFFGSDVKPLEAAVVRDFIDTKVGMPAPDHRDEARLKRVQPEPDP